MKCGLVKAIDTLEICQFRIYNEFFNPKKQDPLLAFSHRNNRLFLRYGYKILYLQSLAGHKLWPHFIEHERALHRRAENPERVKRTKSIVIQNSLKKPLGIPGQPCKGFLYDVIMITQRLISINLKGQFGPTTIRGCRAYIIHMQARPHRIGAGPN